MLFKKENILIFHPGKCGGTTIEHLFLRTLVGMGLAELYQQPCFNNKNNFSLSPECLKKRVDTMTGYLGKPYEINGVSNIYLHHADIQATIGLHSKAYIDSLFKVAFIRNPFPRILSAFYYNALDRHWTFRDFVLTQLQYKKDRNKRYVVSHFDSLHRYTHYKQQQYVDFIGKLENIEDDVKILSKAVDLPLDLYREHRHAKTVSSSKYPHYSAAYDDDMVQHVYKLYSDDFSIFNYEFERVEAFYPSDN